MEEGLRRRLADEANANVWMQSDCNSAWQEVLRMLHYSLMLCGLKVERLQEQNHRRLEENEHQAQHCRQVKHAGDCHSLELC